MIQRTVYQCEHCKAFKSMPRAFYSRDYARKHEYGCFYNPKNKTCFTCNHNNYGKYDHMFNTRINECELGLSKENDITNGHQVIKDCESWEPIGVEEEEIYDE